MAQHVLEHGPVDGAVGGDGAEHGAHVGVDHAGAFGDGTNGDGLAADLGGHGDLLDLQVGGQDGVGRVVGCLLGVSQSRHQGGDPGLDGSDVQLHADDAGGADGEVLGSQARGGGRSGGHALGIFHALGGAGVGVAAVQDDALGLVIGQMLLGQDHGVGLDHVAGVRPGGGAGHVRQDHGQVLLVGDGGGEVIFHAAVDACGLKTFGGGHAAGDDIHGKILLYQYNPAFGRLKALRPRGSRA